MWIRNELSCEFNNLITIPKPAGQTFLLTLSNEEDRLFFYEAERQAFSDPPVGFLSGAEGF